MFRSVWNSSAVRTNGEGGNRTRDLTVRKPVSNRCAKSARSRLEFSTSPINDIVRIILHCLVCYTYIQRTWLAPKFTTSH